MLVDLGSTTVDSGTAVSRHLFGTNLLYGVNTDASGLWDEQIGTILEASRTQDVRLPGGLAESHLDITRLLGGDLRPELRALLDPLMAARAQGEAISATLVVPTKSVIDAAGLELFFQKLLLDYGPVVGAIAIGNEYSVGDPASSSLPLVHPEFDSTMEKPPAIDEWTYGKQANIVLSAYQSALISLPEPISASVEPKFLLQVAAIAGGGSAFKGTGDVDGANRAILAGISAENLALVDGTVVHYYYNQRHEETEKFRDMMGETRDIEDRQTSFEFLAGREFDLYVTEWNVKASNHWQHGQKAAGVVLQQMEYMIEMGVDAAFTWPANHATRNSLTIIKDGVVHLSPAGQVIAALADRLGDGSDWRKVSLPGQLDDLPLTISAYASQDTYVFWIGSRSHDHMTLDLDLSGYGPDWGPVTETRFWFDEFVSDGLSMDQPDGTGRLGRRPVETEELMKLQELPFFDPENQLHLKSVDGSLMTYLPTVGDILPRHEGAVQMDEFFFVSEADVPGTRSEFVSSLSQGRLPLSLRPFEVIEIAIERAPAATPSKIMMVGSGMVSTSETPNVGEELSFRISAFGDGARIVGSDYSDEIAGTSGADTLQGRGGADRLAGGAGPDTFVFLPGDGHDRILDWEVGIDRIDLRAHGLQMPEVQELLQNGLLLEFGSDSVLLMGVQTELVNDDFI